MLARRGEGATVVLRGSATASPDLRQGSRIVPRRSPAARELRPSGAGQGASLLAEQRHRLHGDAVLPGPHIEGRAPGDARGAGRSLAEGLIEPLLGALERLHAHGVYHRDIAPDNILVLPDGRPVLLDFGCARRAVAGGSQWFTAHLKPQFAPLEQYADEGSVGQGPWTDLYSLGATLHFVVTGRAPTASVARAVRDTLPALSSLPQAGALARPARRHRLDPRPRARRSAAGRRDGSTCAPRRDHAAATTAGADRGRRPGRRGGTRGAGGHGAEARSVAGRRCAAGDGASRSRRALGRSAVDRVRRSGRAGLGPGGTDRGLAGGDPAGRSTRWPRSAGSSPSAWRTPCPRSSSCPRSPRRLEARPSSPRRPPCGRYRRPLRSRSRSPATASSRRVPRRRGRQCVRCRPPPATARASAVATVRAC